jgi:hypothetical protein
MKITSLFHGIIDYAVVLFLWLSPLLFNLPDTTAIITYILGGVHLLLTLSTDFEAGIFNLIPLKIHGFVELAVSIGLIPLALYLGQVDGAIARNFYIAFAVAVFFTWVLTDYRNQNASLA